MNIALISYIGGTLTTFDVFYYYISTLTFILVIVALLLVYRYFLGNRIIQQSKKLQLLINKIPREVLENASNPSDLVTSGIGAIGLQGLADELGIDLPGILKNPLVKGLVEKYAPRVLEQLSKSTNKGANNVQEGF